MKILQITDPHLYGCATGRLRGVETDSSLQHALEQAYARIPDFEVMLLTGDLVQDDPKGYLRLRSILGNLAQPVLCIPGNHDDPVAMRRELNVAPFRICGAHEFGDWQFVMLDSYEPGRVGGRLSAAELARLDDALGRSAKFAVVCLHHHPIDMGSRWLDTVGLANPDEFWRVIDTHPNVRAVVWGHVHQAFDGRRGAVRLFGTPSTCAQFVPKSDGFCIDSRPPAYRTFALGADGSVHTAIHWVDSVPMPKAAAR